MSEIPPKQTKRERKEERRVNKKKNADAYRERYLEQPSRRSKAPQHTQDTPHTRRKRDAIGRVKGRNRLGRKNKNFRDNQK